jgi:TonB family protein
MRLLLPAILALAAAAPPPAHPTLPLRQPTKSWILDYGETGCTALRDYGTPEKPMALAFRPSPNGKIVRIAVARGGTAPDAHHFPVTLELGGAPLQTTGLRFATKDGKTDVTWINVDRSALDGLAAAREFSLRGPDAFQARFALPQMGAVLKGLDECIADLGRYWNIDGAGIPIATPPAPLIAPAKWIRSDDYPSQSLRQGEDGSTRFILLVDEAGQVKDCMVEKSSGIASLDAQACIVVVKRARFHPALDSAGKPIRSTWSTTVRFRLP